MSAITDLIGNSTSSSYSAPTQYNTWQPQYTNQLDNTYYNSINQSTANNPYTANAPIYNQILSNQLSNPYASPFQTAANTAGASYGQAGLNDIANANALSGYATNLVNTSNNPQSGLYNQLQQQNTDQTNASEAARGITNSGYGASLANQSNQNFNQGWTNNLQSLQNSALGTANNAYGTANTLYGQGANYQGLAGQTPYDAQNTIQSNYGNALSTYGQQTGNEANSLTNQNLSSILNYLGLGAQQSNAQGNFDQQYWQDQNAYTSEQNAQNSSFWGSLGNLVGSGANSYNTTSGAGPFALAFLGS